MMFISFKQRFEAVNLLLASILIYSSFKVIFLHLSCSLWLLGPIIIGLHSFLSCIDILLLVIAKMAIKK